MRASDVRDAAYDRAIHAQPPAMLLLRKADLASVHVVVVVLATALIVVAMLLALPGSIRHLRQTSSHEALMEAREQYELGDFESAVGAAREAAHLDPSEPGPHALLGRILESQGDSRAAKSEYALSLRLDPSQEEIRYRMAVIDAAHGDTRAAEGGLRAVLSARSDYIPALLLLAQLYERRGDTTRAVNLYELLIQLEPMGVDLEEIQARAEAIQ